MTAENLNEEQHASLHLLHKTYPVAKLLRNLTVIPSEELMQRLAFDIQDQMEIRIQLFFQQLMLVYKTGRVYKLHHTNCQIGSGASNKKQRETTIKTRSVYAAAHSSTIPSLKYTENGEEIVFALGSMLTMTWNTTTLLPKETNKIDLMIDGKNNENDKLRGEALAILNQTAKTTATECSIVSGLQDFLQTLRQKIENIEPNRSNIVEQYTLTSYRIVVDNYLSNITRNLFLKKISFMVNAPNDPNTTNAPYDYLRVCAKVMQEQASLNVHGVQLAPTRVGAAEERSTIEIFLGRTPSLRESSPLVVKTVLDQTRVSQTTLDGKALTYKNYCSSSPTILALANSYLSNCESKPSLSDLKKSVKEVIKDRFSVNAHKISEITQALLNELKPAV